MCPGVGGFGGVPVFCCNQGRGSILLLTHYDQLIIQKSVNERGNQEISVAVEAKMEVWCVLPAPSVKLAQDMVDPGAPSDQSAVVIKEEVVFSCLPNNYHLPIQEDAAETGNKPLSVADGVKKEVLLVHFQNKLYKHVKDIGTHLADQSNVLETKDKEEVVFTCQLHLRQLPF